MQVVELYLNGLKQKEDKVGGRFLTDGGLLGSLVTSSNFLGLVGNIFSEHYYIGLVHWTHMLALTVTTGRHL